jgi:hypothetical protein
MRPKALSCALALVALSTTAQADPDRIVFRDGSDTPAVIGAHAQANAVAFARLGSMLKSWPSPSPWSLIVISDRADICRGTNPCEAPMMLWRRQGAATAKALSAGGNALSRRPALREAFLDELSLRPELGAPGGGHSALFVRLFTEPVTRSSACPVDVAVEDRDLPATLSGTAPTAVHGQHVPLGSAARLTTRLGTTLASASAVFWELGDGAFCKAGTETSRIEGVPRSARAVHFVFGRPPTQGKIPGGVIADCNGDVRRTVADNTRGMHSHGQNVPQGSVQPAGVSCLLTISVTPIQP